MEIDGSLQQAKGLDAEKKFPVCLGEGSEGSFARAAAKVKPGEADWMVVVCTLCDTL